MNVVPLPAPDGSAAQHVRELLVRCEAGEVLAVTVLEERPDGTYTVHGSACADKFRTAGMLLDAARARLENAGG